VAGAFPGGSVAGAFPGFVKRDARPFSLRLATNGLDIVAVRVANKCAEVIGVVFRPERGLVEHRRPLCHRGGKELSHPCPVGSLKCEMRFSRAVTGGALSYPELRSRPHTVTDSVPEVHDALAPERGQHGIVKGGTGGDVATLDRKVVYHVPIMADWPGEAGEAGRLLSSLSPGWPGRGACPRASPGHEQPG
jgi:hypothetical protein